MATVVSIHGHEATSALDGPLLQTSGINDNIGLPLQEATLVQSQVQTFLGIVAEADHCYIQGTHDGAPGGVETPAIIARLRYWIYRSTETREGRSTSTASITSTTDELCERFF